jgi:hypothetical protein
MLEFVRKSFRGFFEFWLWLNLIFFVIIGGVCGNNLLASRGSSGGAIFVGLIVGAIIGLIIDILGGGLIATFLEMAEDIKKIAEGNVAGELHGEPSVKNAQELPQTNSALTVIKETRLYKNQDDYTEVVRMLNPDENVSYVKAGNKVPVGNITAPMFYIKTDSGEEGWCFSGFLK